jgi:hypothetical protein
MMKGLLILPAATLSLALAGCNKPDTPSETANSAQADAAMSSAGDNLKAGLDQIGDAATNVASGVEAGGKVLVKKGKDAASDAASDVSTAADKASSKLKD